MRANLTSPCWSSSPTILRHMHSAKKLRTVSLRVCYFCVDSLTSVSWMTGSYTIVLINTSCCFIYDKSCRGIYWHGHCGHYRSCGYYYLDLSFEEEVNGFNGKTTPSLSTQLQFKRTNIAVEQDLVAGQKSGKDTTNNHHHYQDQKNNIPSRNLNSSYQPGTDSSNDFYFFFFNPHFIPAFFVNLTRAKKTNTHTQPIINNKQDDCAQLRNWFEGY